MYNPVLYKLVSNKTFFLFLQMKKKISLLNMVGKIVNIFFQWWRHSVQVQTMPKFAFLFLAALTPWPVIKSDL